MEQIYVHYIFVISGSSVNAVLIVISICSRSEFTRTYLESYSNRLENDQSSSGSLKGKCNGKCCTKLMKNACWSFAAPGISKANAALMKAMALNKSNYVHHSQRKCNGLEYTHVHRRPTYGAKKTTKNFFMVHHWPVMWHHSFFQAWKKNRRKTESPHDTCKNHSSCSIFVQFFRSPFIEFKVPFAA